MINKVLLILLYFNFVQTQNSDDLPFFDFTNVIKELANIAILQSLNLSSNLNISEDCKKILFESYNGKNKDLYNSIIVYDSSKSNNDLAIYSDCLNGNIEYPNVNKESIKNETTFIVFFFNEKQENISFTNLTKDLEYIIIGLCIPKGCEEQEYSAIFHEISSEISLLNDYVETYVFDLRKDDNENRIIKCIPLFIIIFIFFFSIFKWIPCFIFTFFFKLNNEKEIQKCFLITDNMDEILSQNYSGKNLATNDMGLFAIRGIKSLTLILILFSESFQQIYQIPAKIFSLTQFSDLLRNELFTFVQFGDRFGTRLLYGLSGFILSFKMLYYLDNEVEKKDDIINENKDEEDIINESEEEDNNNKILDKPLSSIINDNKNNNKDINDLNDKKKIDYNIYHKYRKNLSNGVLYKFMFRQSYKYIMFVILVFYFKFSLINQFRLFQNNSPMYCYCQNHILNMFKTIQIIGNIFLFSPFFKETHFSYDPFNIVYNEIFFFIFGTILIYLSYKNSLRLDIIILLLFMVLEIGKFLVFYFLFFNDDETKRFYPIMFFQSQTYKYILSNPFYNMSSMLIGLLFGMVNYCIQNNIKANENIKSFLKIPKSIIHLMKRNDFILFILVVFFLALLLATNFFFFFLFKTKY